MIILAAAALTWAGCGNKTQGEAATEADSLRRDTTVATTRTDSLAVRADSVVAPPEDVWTEDAVEEAVRQMYERRNQMVEAGGIDLSALDQEFCSSYYLELKKRIDAHNAKKEGEIFYGDETGERWLSSVFAPLDISAIEPELLSGDQARATVHFKIIDPFADYMKDIHQMSLWLWLEDGQWRVNDFEQTSLFGEDGYLGMMEQFAFENDIPRP